MSFDPETFKFEIFTSEKSANDFRAIFNAIQNNPDSQKYDAEASHPYYCDENRFQGMHGDESLYHYYQTGDFVAVNQGCWGYSTRFIGQKTNSGEFNLFVQDRPLRGDSRILISLGISQGTAQNKIRQIKQALL